MKLRILVSASVIAAAWLVVPAGAAGAATPTCHGKAATITGTSASELLIGTPGNDVIVGNGGADSIYGLAGNDTICGGQLDDYINGGKGNDIVDGDRGQDTLFGGDDKDQIFGGPGVDTCTDVTPAEENASNEHDCDADFQASASVAADGNGGASMTGKLVNAGPSSEHDSLLNVDIVTTGVISSASISIVSGYHASVSNCTVPTQSASELSFTCTVDASEGSNIKIAASATGSGTATFSVFASPGKSVDPDWTNNTASQSIQLGNPAT